MTKESIKRALIRAADGAMYVTHGDIKRCFGCGNDRAAFITNGLRCIKFQRTKLFDVEDVAERIYGFTEV